MERTPVLVDNAADPEQVKHGRQREQRDARDRHTLVATQLSTPEGRRFVWHEIERHGVFDVVTGSMEVVFAANAAANMGRDLLAEVMQQHPALFLQMQAEAIGRQQTRRDEMVGARTKRRTDGEPEA